MCVCVCVCVYIRPILTDSDHFNQKVLAILLGVMCCIGILMEVHV